MFDLLADSAVAILEQMFASVDACGEGVLAHPRRWDAALSVFHAALTAATRRLAGGHYDGL